MRRTQGIQRTAALILVIGLLAAPAAMAQDSRSHQGPVSVFASIDQLVSQLVSDVGEWLGAVFQPSTTDSSGDLIPIGTDGTGSDGGDSDSSTDSGPVVDPNG